MTTGLHLVFQGQDLACYTTTVVILLKKEAVCGCARRLT